MQTLIVHNDKMYRVLDGTVGAMFKELSSTEEQEFVQWARKHLQDEVRSVYHPVIQHEMLMAQEQRAERQARRV